MDKLNMDWVKSQIQAAKVRKPVGDATVKLVELFDSFENLTPEFKSKTIDLFSKLALGHAVIKENKNESWTQVRPGDIRVSEQVRVKADAFDGDLGTLHNGRRGVVVGVRYGDVIVKMTDNKQPQLEGAHYPPQKLEKLVLA
jgi:hypothetical protein